MGGTPESYAMDLCHISVARLLYGVYEEALGVSDTWIYECF